MNRSTLIAFMAGGMSARKPAFSPFLDALARMRGGELFVAERTRSGCVNRAVSMTAGS
jgi:hypothetical protein